MATTKISLVNSAYTQVLSGAGFTYSEDKVMYFDSATQPAATAEGMRVPKNQQFIGLAGKVIWAKSVDAATATVFSNPEA